MLFRQTNHSNKAAAQQEMLSSSLPNKQSLLLSFRTITEQQRYVSGFSHKTKKLTAVSKHNCSNGDQFGPPPLSQVSLADTEMANCHATIKQTCSPTEQWEEFNLPSILRAIAVLSLYFLHSRWIGAAGILWRVCWTEEKQQQCN